MTDLRTIEAGALTVASAFPDPPFEVEQDGKRTGFDAELMQAICARLGLAWKLVPYEGDDFNGIFDGLRDGRYDAVISGTTITPERRKVARFSRPYLRSGQSLVVNTARTPGIRSTDDLTGHVVGIQRGNTSDIVARKLLAAGKLGDIHYYPYHGILEALDDLGAGRIDGFMKLYPVMTWLVRDRPDLAVVQEIPTHEDLGIAVALDNEELGRAIDEALASERSDGTITALEAKWLGEAGA